MSSTRPTQGPGVGDREWRSMSRARRTAGGGRGRGARATGRGRPRPWRSGSARAARRMWSSTAVAHGLDARPARGSRRCARGTPRARGSAAGRRARRRIASSEVVHRREQVALAHGRARGAADVELPAALDRDEPDVLDVGLGAVARAAGDRGLDLVRRVEAFHRALELDPDAHRVAEPEAAEVGADARLDRAHRLGVGVAGRHVELLPDRRELLLADAEQVDPLAAGDLDQRHLVAVGDVGDPAQLVGGGDAAADARDDARTCRRSGCSRGRGR